MNVSKILLYLFLFVCTSCNSNDSIVLKTNKSNLEYSIFLENDLANLGLVDMTKLSETLKVEIEEMEIVRYANIPSASYNAQIVIVDANKNGKYEFDGVDLIGLSSFKDKLNFQAINFEKSSKPIFIKIENRYYELKLHEDGSQVELVNQDDNQLNYDLTYPYKLPNVSPKRLTKDALLNKENGKYTYVEFWGTWCKPCLEIVPEVKKLKEDFGDRLNVVGVNYQDKDLDRVKRCIIKYQMNWDHIVAEDELLKEFGNPRFVPCGILFDPKGFLVQYGISPEAVREFLISKD